MRSDPPTVGPHEKLDFRYGRTTARNHSGRGMPCKHSQKRLPTNGYPNLQRKKRHAKIYNHQNSLRMEERKLDARESMELISRMIQNTRNRLENHAGRPFLVWGYTTVGIALLNYWFNIAGCHPAWCFTWFLIPIIGCLLMRLFPDKKPTEPRTEIDRIVGKVWLVSSLSLIPIFLFSLFHGLSYRHSLFELITLVMATATATTGMIVRSKIYIVTGLTCMALSVLFPLYDYFLKKSQLLTELR